MTIDPSNYNTKCRTKSAKKKMEEEENEGVRTVECLRGRLLAERQVSRSAKEDAELITRKMQELERHLKEEIRLREKAEKRLKFLIKKLEFIKRSRSLEGAEKSSSSDVSCLSSVCTSTSKEEEKETQGNKSVEEDKTDQATESVASMEEDSQFNKGEASVVASTSGYEEELEAGIQLSWCSDTT